MVHLSLVLIYKRIVRSIAMPQRMFFSLCTKKTFKYISLNVYIDIVYIIKICLKNMYIMSLMVTDCLVI